MKTTKPTKRPAKPSTRGRFDLIERKRPHRRLISFPGVEGKIAKAVQLYTTGGYHSITLQLSPMLNIRTVSGRCRIYGELVAALR